MSISTLSLIESLLLHDRPAAWWGLDTADPLTDDARYGTTQAGYTLSAIGTPSNSASLHTRGDTGASGCRDFNGSTGGYYTAGKVTREPEGPPAYVGSASATATSASGTVVTPGGIQVGDLLLVIAAHPTATATVSTAPAGYTLVGSVLNCTSHAKAVYRKTAVQADTVPQEVTVVWNSSAAVATAIIAYRGCDPDVANLVYDSGEQVTASGTYHSTTSETFPDGARQLVIWTKDASGALTPDPLHANPRLQVSNGSLTINVTDYEQAAAGSGARACTTASSTTCGATLVTFGSPRKVLDDALDTLAANLSVYFLMNADTLSGTDTIVSKHQAWHVDCSGTTLRFRYRDGGGTDRTVNGPALTTGTTQRVWVRDDGSTIYFTVNGSTTSAARVGAAGYTQNANRVCIAHAYDGTSTSAFYDGRLDEVAIFPAYLSDAMVTTHEQAATSGVFGDYIQAARSRYPRAKLELAVDSNPTDITHVFSDITGDVRHEGGLTIARQRNDPLDRMNAGTMSFTLDNRTRAYDDLLPRRVVRFRAQVATDGPVYCIFFGYTESPSYQRPAMGRDSTVELTATDIFKALALNKVPSTLVRPRENAGARLEAVLAGVAGIRWSLEAGHHAIEGADLQGVTRLEHAQAVAETDGGVFFGDARGIAVFQDNQHRAVSEASVRATYGWVGTSAGLPCKSFEPEVDETRLYTQAAVTPSSGVVQRAENAAASAQFFPLTKEMTTLHASDIDALAMAHQIVNVYSVPLKRVPRLVLQPAAAASPSVMWQAVLEHEISQRVKTIEKPIGGAEVEREHFIEGISHQLDANDWLVSLQLSPIELDGEWFVIGTSRIGGDDVIGW